MYVFMKHEIWVVQKTKLVASSIISSSKMKFLSAQIQCSTGLKSRVVRLPSREKGHILLVETFNLACAAPKKVLLI